MKSAARHRGVKGEVQLEAPPAPSLRYVVPAVPAGVLGWRSECWLTPRRETAGCVYGYQQQSQQDIDPSLDSTRGMARAAEWTPGMALPMPS